MLIGNKLQNGSSQRLALKKQFFKNERYGNLFNIASTLPGEKKA